MQNQKANRMQAVSSGMSATANPLGDIGARFDRGKGLTGRAEKKLNNMGYTDDQILSARQAGGGMEGFQSALTKPAEQDSLAGQDMQYSTPYQEIDPGNILVPQQNTGISSQINHSMLEDLPKPYRPMTELPAKPNESNMNYALDSEQRGSTFDKPFNPTQNYATSHVMPSGWRGSAGMQWGNGSLDTNFQAKQPKPGAMPSLSGRFRPGRFQAGFSGMGIGSTFGNIQYSNKFPTQGYR
jgi:hypothetical protein